MTGVTKLLFATNNQHKISEIQSAVGTSVKVAGLKDSGINIDIPEPHDTLEKKCFRKVVGDIRVNRHQLLQRRHGP